MVDWEEWLEQYQVENNAPDWWYAVGYVDARCNSPQTDFTNVSMSQDCVDGYRMGWNDGLADWMDNE